MRFYEESDEHEFLVDDDLLLNSENNSQMDNNEAISFDNFITTTNTGKLAVEVNEKINYGFKFARSNILNNVGSSLASG